MTSFANRRAHPRFTLSPEYTPIRVRTLDQTEFRLEGHSYNISKGGIQFELDMPIEPGTPIAIEISLPTRFGAGRDIGPGRAVFAMANVVWIDDDDVTGPVRMAAAFTRFCRVGDEARLAAALCDMPQAALAA